MVSMEIIFLFDGFWELGCNLELRFNVTVMGILIEIDFMVTDFCVD